ncbi:hypothetical protein FRB95_010962 [Tulasnella sp. JGI-2019a]|nr:hypothetical protein FRB95_010962 [Tulasnella sp. JGI-2019a]
MKQNKDSHHYQPYFPPSYSPTFTLSLFLSPHRILMRNFFTSSSTQAPDEIAEMVEAARVRQVREDRRKEHLQLGRAQMRSMARNSGRPGAPTTDNTNQGLSPGSGNDSPPTSNDRDDDMGGLQGLSDTTLSHVTTSADGKVILNQNAARLFHGGNTVRRTEEALRAMKNVAKDPTYLESGQYTLLRRNLPSLATALWQPTPTPAADAMALFTGQTTVFCHLVQMTLYYVAEGLSLSQRVSDVMRLVLAGSPPPEDTIDELWRERNRLLRDCPKLIAEMEELVKDLEDSPIIDLAVSENAATQRQQNLWRVIFITGIVFAGLSAVATCGAEVANLADHANAMVKATVTQTASVATYVACAGTGTMYQLAANNQSAERHKKQADMLSSAFGNLVDIKHCVKHFKNSFEDLLQNLNLPLFEDHTFGDESIVLDKWMTTHTLYGFFHEHVKEITKAMLDNGIALPAHPYPDSTPSPP